ncbi:Tfp pilus assembly protein FimT/FimU [Sulfurimonas sp.]|uniref:pilus assembly FimT family protein n=1 Tax=Sulfurimonas sp. TaxID=2022749 RepID=UPI0035693343
MKKAFTMLELVFVLVVIGILAAVMIPQMQSTKLREAAIQLVSHIRYTQHLAMVDDKFDSNDTNWYKSRWQIIFGKNNRTGGELAYSIYSDSPNYGGSASQGEIAIDPADMSKILSGGSSAFDMTNEKANIKLNLGISYDIDTETSDLMKGGCAGQVRLTFDHLGRPIQGTINGFTKSYEVNKLIQTRCDIVLTSPEGNVTIAIEPETGYAHILDS